MIEENSNYQLSRGDVFIICENGLCNLCRVESVITFNEYDYIKSFRKYSKSNIEEVTEGHTLFELPKYAKDKYIIESWREQTVNNLLSFPFEDMEKFLEVLETLKSISDWEKQIDD